MASTTKFTEKAQEAILARSAKPNRATSRSSSRLRSSSLCSISPTDSCPRSCRKLEVDPAAVRRGCRAEFEGLPKLSYAAQPAAQQQPAQGAAEGGGRSQAVGRRVRQRRASAARHSRRARYRGGELLARFGVTKDRVYEALTQIRGGQRVTTPIRRTSTRRWRSTAAT